MCDRKNTLVCIFDMRSPRISAYLIHEWIHENLHLEEDDIRTLQIDGPRRRVYIKLNSETRLQEILNDTQGQLTFYHDNGEISKVLLELADAGIKKIRIARLPPEVNADIIKTCLLKFGEVKTIRDEMWTQAYRYKVYNGVRIVEIRLKQHLPSHLLIAGHDALVSYDGQPPTCFRCNGTGHQIQDCPRRRAAVQPTQDTHSATWADIVAQTERDRQTTVAPSSIIQPLTIGIEGTDAGDTDHGMDCTNQQTTGLNHATTPLTDLDQPTHSTNTDQVLVNPSTSRMEPRNIDELTDSSPSINIPMTPVEQVPQSPQIQHTAPDIGEYQTQVDERGNPMEQDDSNLIHSDDELHHSLQLGSPTKKKKLKTGRASSKKDRDRTRSRSRQPMPQTQ